jgi:hypothetical protein
MQKCFVVVNSINVYEQYWAECPGLSIRPSPKKTLFIVTNKILKVLLYNRLTNFQNEVN